MLPVYLVLKVKSIALNDHVTHEFVIGVILIVTLYLSTFKPLDITDTSTYDDLVLALYVIVPENGGEYTIEAYTLTVLCA